MNINGMMKQAKKMQAELERKQKEIDKQEFKVTKQGIEVILYGTKKIKSIDINKDLIDPDDKEIVEDLIILAINEAQEIIDEKIDSATPKMPGNMPF